MCEFICGVLIVLVVTALVLVFLENESRHQADKEELQDYIKLLEQG